jgi:hypothetical protein
MPNSIGPSSIGHSFASVGAEPERCKTSRVRQHTAHTVAPSIHRLSDETAAYFQIPPHRIQAAFDYYQAYPEEIDRPIAENRAITFDEIKRMLPHAERFTVCLNPDDGEASA